MQRIYVLESGTYLKKSGENLALVKDGKTLEEVAIQGLSQLILVGYTSISGAVLRVLMEHRVETVLLSPRGRFEGRLSVDEHKHVARRKHQYLRLSEEPFVLRTARAIVGGKVRSQARFLSVRGQQLREEPLLTRAATLRAMERALLDPETDLEFVRAIEGNTSRVYFEGFPRLLRNPQFSFKGRTRRPPLDPVNALLSFVYTLLTNEVLTAIKVVGLDPYLGALHVEDYGRPSLACDLVEEWRVFLGDRFVLGLLNRKALGPSDFVYREVKDTDFVDEEELKKKRPVEMKPGTSRALLDAYERWMGQRIKDRDSGDHQTYRGLILQQVRRFERYLSREDEHYEPFPWSEAR